MFTMREHNVRMGYLRSVAAKGPCEVDQLLLLVTSTDLWVPPPRTLGIRATARPVPQDSALVW